MKKNKKDARHNVAGIFCILLQGKQKPFQEYDNYFRTMSTNAV